MSFIIKTKNRFEMEIGNKIVLFEERHIRKVWYNDQWYFSVVDVIDALTDSNDPKRYWADLKRRAEKESGEKVFAFCEPLKMQTAGGKQSIETRVLSNLSIKSVMNHGKLK